MGSTKISKLIVVAFIFAFLGSCKTTKTGNTFIPYDVPFSTEKAIYNRIQQLQGAYKYIAFSFYFNDDTTIDVYMHADNKGYDIRHKLTNRKIFVNDRFYPLDFNLDQTFQMEMKNDIPIAEKHCWTVVRPRSETYETIKIPSIEEREKLYDNPDCSLGRRLRQLLIDYQPILKINLKGQIIEPE